MNPQEYIDRLVAQVHDEALRTRLKEELAEHLQDSNDEYGMPDESDEVLGDATLIARQVNTIASPGGIAGDFSLAALSCIATFFMSIILTSFFSIDVDIAGGGHALASILAGIIGISIWVAAAYILYLALHRRLLVRHGRTTIRAVLLLIAFWAPWIVFSVAENAGSIVQNPTNVVHRIIVAVAASGLLLGTFLFSGKNVITSMAATDVVLARLRRSLPWVFSAFIVLGVALILIAPDSLDSDSMMQLISLPFVLPMFMLYFVWGLATRSLEVAAGNLDLPRMMGFWISITIPLAIGVVLPAILWVTRRRVPVLMQFLAGIIVPLAIMLPFVPQDVPSVVWRAPMVWRWENIEQKQLNITLPWAAPLMRQDEGFNIDYRAVGSANSLEVLQGAKDSIIISRENGAKFGRKITDVPLEGWYSDEAYVDLPAGFACNEIPLEEIYDEQTSTFGSLGMFGAHECERLAYNGALIAEINYGGLIDLDLTQDGLLAVSINMGAYDPTYVYVVDVANLMSQ